MSTTFHARNAHAYQQFMGRWSRRLARKFIAFAGLADGERILDVGCGTGSLTFALAEAANLAKIVAIDASEIYLAAARANNKDPRISFERADACALPFKPHTFDLIVSISTLDHLPPAALPDALGELCRVLRPAGCLILTLDSRHNPLHVLSNHIRRWMRRIHAERCYTVNEVVAALARQPVAVTETTAIYHVPFPVNFLAKKARAAAGARADVWIRGVVGLCRRLAALPTRFFTGRYIALRIVKETDSTAGR